MLSSVSSSLLWRGLLAVAIGVVSVAWPDVTVGAIMILLAVAMAIRHGEYAGERAMWALTGLVSIALGIVLAIRPDIGAVSLTTVFGLFSIVYGISTLVLSAQVRKGGSTAQALADPVS